MDFVDFIRYITCSIFEKTNDKEDEVVEYMDFDELSKQTKQSFKNVSGFGSPVLIGNSSDIDQLMMKKYHSNDLYQILVRASFHGDLVCVNWLINKKINIHYQDEEALKQASFHDHKQIVKLLLLNGADPSVDDHLILKKCIVMNKCKIIKILLEYHYPFDNIYPQLIFGSAINGYHHAIKYLIKYHYKFTINGKPINNVKLIDIYGRCYLLAIKYYRTYVKRIMEDYTKINIIMDAYQKKNE